MDLTRQNRARATIGATIRHEYSGCTLGEMRGHARWGCGAVLIGLAALWAGIFATASPAAGGELEMQALLNEDGSGSLFVNTPKKPRTWEVCSPTLTDCAPIQSSHPYEGLDTGDTGPGVVFRVTSGDGSVGISPLWNGRVSSLTPPSIEGPMRANERVTPRPGTWQGGWLGEGDDFQLAACSDSTGTDCTTLTDWNYPEKCSETSVVLDPAFVGDYLRVANTRPGAGPHYYPLYASLSPYGARSGVWQESAITSVAIVGRIAPPRRPRADNCGAPPLNQASINRRGVAEIQCGFGCRAVLIAKRGQQTAKAVLRLKPQLFRPPTVLRMPPKRLHRLGSGRTSMVVKIDGLREAHRMVVLRPDR